ncbi:hypothetical protein [Microcoleus sp. D2_18a_B4]|uniref:hypothetical protein n=1 Tax=Microcoleus sp. D2_18a_B4 TaxID=3055329 RepID=UPI002FD30FE3
MVGKHREGAAGNPPLNPAREKGCTLIASKNQGIYVPVNQHPTELSVWAALIDGIGDLELNITPVILEG